MSEELLQALYKLKWLRGLEGSIEDTECTRVPLEDITEKYELIICEIENNKEKFTHLIFDMGIRILTVVRLNEYKFNPDIPSKVQEYIRNADSEGLSDEEIIYNTGLIAVLREIDSVIMYEMEGEKPSCGCLEKRLENKYTMELIGLYSKDRVKY